MYLAIPITSLLVKNTATLVFTAAGTIVEYSRTIVVNITADCIYAQSRVKNVPS